MQLYKTLKFLFLCLALPTLLPAQFIVGHLDMKDTTDVHIVKFKEKGQDKLKGRILDIREGLVLFHHKSDTLQLKIVDIKKITIRNRPAPLLKVAAAARNERKDSSKQYTVAYHKVELSNGNTLKGRLLKYNATSISFHYQDNVLDIRYMDIQSFSEIRESDGLLSEHYFYPYSLHGHEAVVVSPTGFNLPEGRYEYKTFYGLAHTVEYAFNDYIALTGGYAFPDIGIFRLKATTNSRKKSNLNVGGLFLRSISEDNLRPILAGYVGYTFGQPQRFLNLSVGRSRQKSFWQNEHANLLALSGAIQLNNRWRLFSETLFLFYREEDFRSAYKDAFSSVNAGWYNHANRVDFGLIMSFEDFFYMLPMIAYAHRF